MLVPPSKWQRDAQKTSVVSWLRALRVAALSVALVLGSGGVLYMAGTGSPVWAERVAESAPGDAAEAQPAQDDPDAQAQGLIENPHFEDWDNEHLSVWSVGEGHGKTWRRGAISRTCVGQKGKYALVLPNPLPDDFFIVAQDLVPGKIRPDNTLLIRVRAKAPLAYTLLVKLTFVRGSGSERHAVAQHRYNRKAGVWETIEWKFEVPPDADPNSFRLKLIVQNKDHDGVTFVDSVLVRHEPVRPEW